MRRYAPDFPLNGRQCSNMTTPSRTSTGGVAAEPRRLRGNLAATVSIATATGTFAWCAKLMLIYIPGLYSWCGTPRATAMTTLVLVGPPLILIAATAWLVAHKAQHAAIIARCGFLVTTAVWLTSVVMVFVVL